MENGIDEIELPSKGKLVCNGKLKVGIDYIIENDGTYTFTVKTTTGETITKTLNINDEFRNNIIQIEKVQEIKTEQDFRVIRDVEGWEWYYSIGKNNEDWIEIPNYNILNIDSYKILEKNLKNEDGSVTLNVKRIHPRGNCVQVSKTVDGLLLDENTFNNEEQILEGESLIACIRDNKIKSGNYRLKINGEEYPTEIYNYDENVNYIADKNLGTSESDNRMVIMKYNGNLNINNSRLVTAETRKKGMFLYVEGSLTNSGEISMSGKGTESVGQNVYLWKNAKDNYEFVPAVGGMGGASVTANTNNTWNSNSKDSVYEDYNKGNEGEGRKTGGGRSGSAYAKSQLKGNDISAYGGKCGNGTSYSGGISGTNGSALVDNMGKKTYNTGKDGANTGGDNSGGLLIISANILENTNGKITADSLKNGNGGGSINIFYKDNIDKGIMQSKGKELGGNGTITIFNINLKSPTIKVHDIKEKTFIVDIEEPNIEVEGITYDYYVNDTKVIENSTSRSEIITKLNASTEYKVYVVKKLEDANLFSNTITTTTMEEAKKYNLGVKNSTFSKYTGFTHLGNPVYKGKEEGIYLNNCIIYANIPLSSNYTILIEAKNITETEGEPGMMIGYGRR